MVLRPLPVLLALLANVYKLFQHSANNLSTNTMYELTFVTSQAINRDGVGYTTRIYRGSNGFIAFWECRCCANQGNLPISTSDRDNVVAKCSEQIEQHHTQYHPKENE